MKKIIYLGYTLSLMLLVCACDQDVIDLQQPEVIEDTSCEDAQPGTANFSKFVTIGESLVAGFQAGALFTEGQNNSLGAILADKLECVGGSTTFNQPDINSANGYNATYSIPGVITLGRLILFDADGATGPKGPLPTPAGAPGVPAPYNTADAPTPYTGDKSKLNNFAVPGVQLLQFIAPQTGGPASGNPAYNPLYARFASNPGTSTILGDALAAQPTFFLFWGGNNDVLGYAVSGASNEGLLTSEADFQQRYGLIVSTILGSNENLKGVIGNIPDVTSIPHFTTVKYNNIPLDAATAATLNGAFGGYNQILNALKGAPFNLPAAEVDARKITFSAGNNAIVIADESVHSYKNEFDMLYGAGQIDEATRNALKPYEQVRQATPADLFPLSAGSVLGTIPNGGNAQTIIGLTVPLADQYTLTKAEVEVVRARTLAFNNYIKGVAAQNSRIALADVNATFAAFVQAAVQYEDNVTITPNFTPPTGTFSEDGVHPNSRGYAYTANIFINAINAKFGSTVPLVKIGAYGGTALPVYPAGL